MKKAKRAPQKPAAAIERVELTPIDRLRAARSRRVEADRTEARLVSEARNAGYSWSAIGGALGVSGQAVQQRAERRLQKG